MKKINLCTHVEEFLSVSNMVYFFFLFSDSALVCDVCPLAIFNAHILCTQCGLVTCISCDPNKEMEKRGTAHSLYPAVVHSDLRELEEMLKEIDKVMRHWNVNEKTPTEANSHSLKTANVVKEKCFGSTIHHNAIEQRLLMLSSDDGNDKAFRFLCEAGECLDFDIYETHFAHHLFIKEK